ncbi:MAG: ABC transporter ATP-binding protein [Nitrospira sp.]|nr:ABC transporter ATP-binding protein [Nitrospira sp.]
MSGVSKKFSRSVKRAMVYGAYDLGLALLGRTDQTSLRESEFWALRDVTFALKWGRSLGVVGPNGSGKTTLMRLIAGVLAPTSGHIRVNGRIAPMLALGAGFKPVLSGRENIFLNLSLLGVPYQEISDRLEAIIDFAEIGEAIDAPIGTYSSGMVARLGFACAVYTSPQVLIVDEVLSVGDAGFRRKCRNRINDLRRDGTAMLLVSHSAILIQALADQCMYLKDGIVAALGSPTDVLHEYEADVMFNSSIQPSGFATTSVPDFRPAKTRSVRVKNIHCQAEQGERSNTLISGRPGHISVILDCAEPMADVSVNIIIRDAVPHSGETVLFITSYRDIGWVELNPGRQEFRLNLPIVVLRPGPYHVKVSVSKGGMHDILDTVEDVRLIVRGVGSNRDCLFVQPHEWALNGHEIVGLSLTESSEELGAIEET